MDTAIVWFRRDLRVTDHPALSTAVAEARSVVPLFVLDERLLGDSTSAPARTWFLLRSLVELDRSLRSRGSGLLLRTGRPEEVVPRLAHEIGASAILATRDVTPFSHRRDQAVAAALQLDGRRLRLQPGLLLAEPESMLTATGRPYRVFTPFWRALQQASRRPLLPAIGAIHTPADLLAGSMGVAASLVDREAPHRGLPDAGEWAAQERLRAWVHAGLSGYGDGRDGLDGQATSRLGPDLHLGTLSPLQVETAALEVGEMAQPFVRQVAWREFYHHLLFHRRAAADRVADSPFMAVFRSEPDDPEAVAAWRDGRTGIPAVDAGMRQLAATSWLGNRARLVVASFLTRHLLMDYRIGERHFMRHLVDGDVANNQGGWQWTSGVGADPQPWFRIFNPVLQGQRFDPDGDWVRRWVPELGKVPAGHIHAPWEMPAGIAAEAGVRLGETYPSPIVDLRDGRERALAAFRSVAGDASSAGGSRERGS